MIKIKEEQLIPKLLYKRSKLQEQFVNVNAETTMVYETDYLLKNKKANKLLTLWMLFLIICFLIILEFFLNDILTETIGIVVTILIGVLVLLFGMYILFLFYNNKKLRDIWDEDIKKDNKILEEANSYGKEAAILGLQIMVLNKHYYEITNINDPIMQKQEWKKLVYEYVDAINGYYSNATIDDYLRYYNQWRQDQNEI
jgi:hypothetical protein